MFIDLPIWRAENYFGKAAFATRTVLVPPADWLAILHGLAVAVGILDVPVVLHSAENELHVGFKFPSELLAFLVHSLQQRFVVASPQEGLGIWPEEKVGPDGQVPVLGSPCVVVVEVMLQVVQVALMLIVVVETTSPFSKLLLLICSLFDICFFFL